MKIWEKTKDFVKTHKIVVVSTLVGAATFVTGWVVRKKMDYAIVERALDSLPDKDGNDFDSNTFGLVTDDDVKIFEEEQKELREKYGQDYAILEEAVKNLTEPENGKLWMIENGRVALIDGIESDVKVEES